MIALAHPEHAEVAGAYARLLVDRARYREAHDIPATGDALRVRTESAGLAALPAGDLKSADVALAALEAGATADGDAATSGRALALRATLAEHRGQLGIASDRYREAARRLTEAGELHAAATATLRLGAVLVERGRASDALPRLAEAGRTFDSLGATADGCTAELHRGTALLLIGQVDAARAAAATAVARSTGSPLVRAFALRLAGAARRRLGDAAGALRNYREALAIARAQREVSAQLAAHVALAEVGHCDGAQPGGAPVAQRVRSVEALCISDDDRARWTLARARLALCDPASVEAAGSGESRGAATLALAQACADIAAAATDDDRLERAFRGHAIAAQLAHRAGDVELARSELRSARIAHAALAAALGPALRAAIDGDPDLVKLPELRMPQAWIVTAEPLHVAAGRGDDETSSLEVEGAMVRQGAHAEGAGIKAVAEISGARGHVGSERGTDRARIQADADVEISAARARVGAERAAELARMKVSAEAEIEAARAARDAEFARLEAEERESEAARLGLAAEREAALERLRAEAELELEAARPHVGAARDAALARLQEESEQQLEAARARLAAEREAELERLRAEAELELEAARPHVGAARDAALARLQAESEQQLEAARARLAAEREAELERLRAEAELELEAARPHVGAARDAALASLQAESEQQLEAARARLAAEREAALELLRTEAELDLERRRSQVHAELAHLYAASGLAQLRSQRGHTGDLPARAADDLQLRPALSVVEHAYVTAAMARTRGNQTAAARLLGLSRFGLQKKLRRLAGEPDSDRDADE